MFSRILQMIRQVIHRMIPYKSIEQATSIETPLSTEMAQALDDWYDLYRNMAPWRKGKDGADVKSLNLASQICSTLARQIVLEMKWNITGGEADENGEAPENERSKYLKAEFEKLIDILREKLEIGLAAGGMTIKPYPGQDGHIYFDFTADWSLYPISFGDNSDLTDVIFRDVLTEGKTYYTRLERHVRDGDSVTVTQQAYRSTLRDYIGTEVPLSSVPRWASLEPTAEIKQADGQLSTMQFLEHAAPPSLFLPVSVSQRAQKGNCGLLRGAIRALSRNFGAEIFAEFRFSSYFCHIPAL